MIDFSEEDRVLAAALARKMLALDTDADWSMDVTEDEFNFVLGLLTLVENSRSPGQVDTDEAKGGASP